MESLMTNYPAYFKELMDQAGKLYRIPVNRESVQFFWDRLKKHKKESILLAFEEIFKKEEWFPTVATVIKYIPPDYPEQKEWPDFQDIENVAKSGIAKDSLQLIFKQLGKDSYGHKEYYQEMMKLHDKYPRAGFRDAAEKYKRIVEEKERHRL